MYRVAICDDEPVFLESIKCMVSEILTEMNIMHQITCFTDPEHLLQFSDAPDQFDILLLDILLGSNNNGVTFAKYLRNKGNEISILFITNTKKFSLEAYSVYPLNYLLKPVQKEELAEALKRDLEKTYTPKSVLLPSKVGDSVVAVNSILYLETINRSVIVHTTDRQIPCPGPLQLVLERLPREAFLQCHKSFWVHLKKIQDMSRTQITLLNHQTVPVGRAYYQNALTRLIEYMSN